MCLLLLGGFLFLGSFPIELLISNTLFNVACLNYAIKNFVSFLMYVNFTYFVVTYLPCVEVVAYMLLDSLF